MISIYSTDKNIHKEETPIIESNAWVERCLENGRFKNKFEFISILGRGGFGTVYKVKYHLDNNIYAIKKVKLHLGNTEVLQDHKVYREI
jgi:serine/threonine protein kinase